MNDIRTRSTILTLLPAAMLLLWLTAEMAFAQTALAMFSEDIGKPTYSATSTKSASSASVGTQGASTPFSVRPFTDVPSSRSDFQAIEYLRTHNILKGDYTSGEYHPDQRIRREELVQLLTNEFFMPDRNNSCIASMHSGAMLFLDVSQDMSYATDLCNAKAKGLINGYPDGYFRPTRPVSFVEGAKLVARISTVSMTKTSNDPRWFTVYLQKLSSLNAIPTSIRFLGQPLTRGELAEMIYRVKTDTMNHPSKHLSDFDL